MDSADIACVRGFSPLINIFLTCLAAVAVVPVLGFAWFASAVDSNDGTQGSVELMAEAVARWFTASGATSTGAEVLTSGESVLLAVAGATALLALLMLIPGLRIHLRGVVKLVPLAGPVVVLALILSEAAAAGVEPRYGAFVALALTVFLASAANQAGEMREPKAAPQPYKPGAGRAF